jgi:DNA-binding FadR family transcriptional regulator
VLGRLPARPTAVRAARNALERAILARRIPAGDRLPAERVLATELGVNRTTLRAALRELEVAGLVQVRHGSGYAVRDFTASGGPDLLGPLIELSREGGGIGPIAAELLFVRRHLAGAVLEAVRRAKPPREALRTIAAAIDAFAEATTMRPIPPPTELAALDLGVVQAIVAATGSIVLPLFLNPVSRVLGELPDLAAALYADPASNVAAYRLLHAGLSSAGGLDDRVLAAAVAAMEARDLDTLGRLGGLSTQSPEAPRAPTKSRQT